MKRIFSEPFSVQGSPEVLGLMSEPRVLSPQLTHTLLILFLPELSAGETGPFLHCPYFLYIKLSLGEISVSGSWPSPALLEDTSFEMNLSHAKRQKQLQQLLQFLQIRTMPVWPNHSSEQQLQNVQFDNFPTCACHGFYLLSAPHTFRDALACDTSCEQWSMSPCSPPWGLLDQTQDNKIQPELDI